MYIDTIEYSDEYDEAKDDSMDTQQLFYDANIPEEVLYSKTCLKRPLKKKTKLVFQTDYCLMQVNSIAECSMGLPFVT